MGNLRVVVVGAAAGGRPVADGSASEARSRLSPVGHKVRNDCGSADSVPRKVFQVRDQTV
jgi:hypothetical protein